MRASSIPRPWSILGATFLLLVSCAELFPMTRSHPQTPWSFALSLGGIAITGSASLKGDEMTTRWTAKLGSLAIDFEQLLP